MNLRSELALILAAEATPPASLFFRPADAERLTACLSALLVEGRSLALASPHEAAVGHYGDLLVEQLRRQAPCPVEVYFPASTQAMVARFDELLARRTVREAMSEHRAARPERIWLVHEAGALAEHELQLLARLVGHFPGAGVRLVMLFGPGLRGRQAFESLGRRFLRWDIDTPTPDEARAMRAQACIDGCQALVQGLLRHVQPAGDEAEAEPKPAPRRRGWATPFRLRRWHWAGAAAALAALAGLAVGLAGFMGPLTTNPGWPDLSQGQRTAPAAAQVKPLLAPATEQRT